MEEKVKEKVLVKDNKELANYIDELSKDVKLTSINLREKSLMCSSLWAKWLSYLFHEKETAEKIVAAKQKIMKQKIICHLCICFPVRMKSADKLAENDENLQKLTHLAKLTQSNIDFIERALGILQNFGYSIKNTFEIMKLENR